MSFDNNKTFDWQYFYYGPWLHIVRVVDEVDHWICLFFLPMPSIWWSAVEELVVLTWYSLYFWVLKGILYLYLELRVLYSTSCCCFCVHWAMDFWRKMEAYTMFLRVVLSRESIASCLYVLKDHFLWSLNIVLDRVFWHIILGRRLLLLVILIVWRSIVIERFDIEWLTELLLFSWSISTWWWEWIFYWWTSEFLVR